MTGVLINNFIWLLIWHLEVDFPLISPISRHKMASNLKNSGYLFNWDQGCQLNHWLNLMPVENPYSTLMTIFYSSGHLTGLDIAD